MEKTCLSCGMPLVTPGDFPLADREGKNSICMHCADAEGKLKPYEQVVEGMSAFLMQTEKVSSAQAHAMAEKYLATQPAWAKRTRP